MAGKRSPFVWYDLMTTDTSAAAAFYSAVAGWRVTDSGMTDRYYGILHAGPAMVGGLMPIPDDSLAKRIPVWTGYIGVDDADAYAMRITKAGGAIHRGPADIPDVGRFAVAADPQGAVFIIFTPKTRDAPAATPLGTPGHFGWRELYAADAPKVFGFYADVFGWTKNEAIDMGALGIYQTFVTAGEQGGGMMTKTPDMPHPFWLYYINVDGVEEAMARVAACGGTVLMGPTPVPSDRWIAQARDPQGGMFALLGPKSARPHVAGSHHENAPDDSVRHESASQA